MMTKRYAMIRGGAVENVALWDGKSEWEPGSDWTLMDCPSEVGPGWTYEGGEFIPPPIVEPEPE